MLFRTTKSQVEPQFHSIIHRHSVQNTMSFAELGTPGMGTSSPGGGPDTDRLMSLLRDYEASGRNPNVDGIPDGLQARRRICRQYAAALARCCACSPNSAQASVGSRAGNDGWLVRRQRHAWRRRLRGDTAAPTVRLLADAAICSA